MKAVTVEQPFATLIAEGKKTYIILDEDVQPTELTEEIAIYADVDMGGDTTQHYLNHREAAPLLREMGVGRKDGPFGAVIATATVDTILPIEEIAMKVPRQERHLNPNRLLSAYYGRRAVVVRSVNKITPIKLKKGAKQIWDLPAKEAPIAKAKQQGDEKSQV